MCSSRQVNITITSAWVLGKGPCGSTCTKANVGMSTAPSRQTSLTSAADSVYFGNITMTFPSGSSDSPYDFGRYDSFVKVNLLLNLTDTSTETVVAVNELEQWEQDILTFTVEVEEHSYFEFV